jgi:hypothetical protein
MDPSALGERRGVLGLEDAIYFPNDDGSREDWEGDDGAYCTGEPRIQTLSSSIPGTYLLLSPGVSLYQFLSNTVSELGTSPYEDLLWAKIN